MILDDCCPVRGIKSLWPEWKYGFLGTFISGMLAYGWFFTNKLVNFDDIDYFFTKGVSTESGRWGLDLLDFILPSFSVPWLWGILSVFLISISVTMVLKGLKIRGHVLQFVTGAAVIAFRSQLATFLYMFTAPSYAIALILTVCAFRLLIMEGKSPAALLCALLLEVLSLSIYQAYITVLASLLVVQLAGQIIFEDRFDIPTLIKRSLSCVLFLGLSLGVYYGITMAVMKLSGVQFGDYAAKKLAQSSSLFYRIRDVLVAPKRIFHCRENGLVTSRVSEAAHIICFAIAAASGTAFGMKRDNRWLRAICFLGFSVILLPVSINSLTLLLGSNSNRNITLLSYTSLYFFIALMAERVPFSGKLKVLPAVTAFGLLIIISDNIFYANKIGLLTYLDYENTVSFYTSVVTQLEQTEGFTKDKKIYFVGYQDYSPDYEFDFVDSLDEVYAYQTFRHFHRQKFLKYYLGITLNIESEIPEIQKILDTEEVGAMPSYPDNGFIRNFDDYLVVKLSDSMYMP